MTVSRSTAEPRRGRLSIARRGFSAWSWRGLSARMDQGAYRATDWLSGNCQRRLEPHSKEDSMKADEKKKQKKQSKAVMFLKVTGVIVAYIAIIASLAYPVVTAASGGA